MDDQLWRSMRKLKLQMQASLDGFVSTGPNDEQQWVTWAWEEIQPHVLDLIGSSDTILLGRNLAVGYIPHWEKVVADPGDPFYILAQPIVKAKKIVFSNTLDSAEWKNTEIVRGNLAEEVGNLKKQPGKDLIVYGGSSFVASLIREGLIDEYHFFINPVALGSGISIFQELNNIQPFQLIKTITYDSGIVLLSYTPQNTHQHDPNHSQPS